MAEKWKNFFIRSTKTPAHRDYNQLFVNTARQRGGARDSPIRLVTPSLQTAEQAENSLNQGNFGDARLSKIATTKRQKSTSSKSRSGTKSGSSRKKIRRRGRKRKT